MAINQEKLNLINDASVFNEIILETRALKELFVIRKHYARMYLVNGDEEFYILVKYANDQIKKYLGL